MKITAYAVVKVVIEYNPKQVAEALICEKEDVDAVLLNHIGSECYYSVTFNEPYAKVVDTEMLEFLPHHPE